MSLHPLPAWAVCMCVLLLAFPVLDQAHTISNGDLDAVQPQPAPSRHLAQAEEPPQQQKHPCAALKAGAPVPGQFVLMFDTSKVATLDDGITSLQKAFSAQQPAAQGTTAAAKSLPFDILKEFKGSSSSSSSGGSGSGSGGRRLQQSTDLLLGLVITASDDAVDIIKNVDTVTFVKNDLCVKTAQDIAAARTASIEFGCLPASQVSGITIMPLPESSWPGCFLPGARLAWWGERCGPSNSQVVWTGVYAYNSITGDRLGDCIKVRPGSGELSDDLRWWLGESCGDAPGAVPNMPRLVCSDPFIADSCAASSSTPGACPNQNCIAHGAPVAQTVQIMHPSDSCKPRKPMLMKFVGERCYGDSSVPTAQASSLAAVRWLSAAPAEDVEAPEACSLSRLAGSTPEELLYNQNYFGGCGVPPARIQYLAWGECPAAPPPPPVVPPPPSPRPRTTLPRERVVSGGQTVSAGIKRIMAVTAGDDGVLQTVKQLQRSAVAVLDTGVDCRHTDLNINFTKSFNTERNPIAGQDAACYDGLGHGTHVSGIIGALNNQGGVLGVLPNTPIVALKVMDAEGVGTATDILSALNWLLEPSAAGGAAPTNAQALNIDVVNLSLGFFVAGITLDTEPIGFLMCSQLQKLMQNGLVIVAAASNDGEPLNNIAPACCPGVVAATSMNPGSGAINPQQQASWFSNYLWLAKSPTYLPWMPDKLATIVAAPGYQINSTCSSYRDPSGFCVLSGTSQAVPHIAGVFARCFSSGECRASLGAANTALVLEEFKQYNSQVNPDYGYQQDPLRSPTTNKYYGYLAWAGGW